MRITVLLFVCVFVPLCGAIKLDVFSTKTLYRWAHSVASPDQDVDGSFRRGDGVCNAVQVYAVVRHGARYPSDGAMEDIQAIDEKVVRHKDPALFSDFDTWENRYELAKESLLVQEGIEEQIGLGERFARRFSRLFKMHGDRVKFVSSVKPRASNSSKYFHRGMANETTSLGAYLNEINNTLTRFYDGCYNYEHGVEDNVTHLAEFNKYKDTPEFVAVREAVVAKLGLNTTLSTDDIYGLYDMCAYEKYIYQDELWCALLTDEQRQVLEYGQDLEKYYESGYTHPVIQKMTCPLVRDILHTMKTSVSDTWDYMSGGTDFSNTEYLAGKFVFGHSETTVPLMTAFGLFKDSTDLLSSNRGAMINRQFRTSNIAPFSANLAVALYVCNNTIGSENPRSFAVKMFANEKAVVIPACNNEVCSYEDFVTYYSPVIENCNLTKICGSDDDDNDDDGVNGAENAFGSILSIVVPLFITIFSIN